MRNVPGCVAQDFINKNERRKKSSSCYVLLQVLDDEFLLLDNIFYDIPNGNDAHQFSAFNNWQVPEMLVGHQSHAHFNGSVRSHCKYFAGHDLADLCFF